MKLITLFCVSLSLFCFSSVKAGYDSKYGVDVQNVRVINEDGLRYITGTILNKSSNTYAGFQIFFDLLDSDGAVVANTTDSIMNFQAGSKWRFKCLIIDDSAASYRFSGINGFE